MTTYKLLEDIRMAMKISSQRSRRMTLEHEMNENTRFFLFLILSVIFSPLLLITLDHLVKNYLVVFLVVFGAIIIFQMYDKSIELREKEKIIEKDKEREKVSKDWNESYRKKEREYSDLYEEIVNTATLVGDCNSDEKHCNSNR